MPYTKEELLNNEYWQRLHEQDRVDYQKKLEDAGTFKNATQIVDDEGRVIPINKTTPLRNEAGTFLAFEDPDTGLNYNRPDQRLPVAKNSPRYHSGDLYYQILDAEIKDLVL